MNDLIVKKCPMCGKIFETFKTNKIYCCRDCMKTACNLRFYEKVKNDRRRARLAKAPVRQCVVCGASYKRKTANQKCCSSECSAEHKRRYNTEYRREAV